MKTKPSPPDFAFVPGTRRNPTVLFAVERRGACYLYIAAVSHGPLDVAVVSEALPETTAMDAIVRDAIRAARQQDRPGRWFDPPHKRQTDRVSHSCGQAERLHKMLRGHPGGEEALDAFARVCGRALMHTLICSARAPTPLQTANMLRIYRLCGFRDAEAFFARWPFLLFALASWTFESEADVRKRSRAVGRIVADHADSERVADGILSISEGQMRDVGLSLRVPSADGLAAFLRRVSGYSWETWMPAARAPRIDSLAIATSCIPRDWLPDQKDLFGFLECARTAGFHAFLLPPSMRRQVFEASKGRWGDYNVRIAKTKDTRPAGAHGIRDLVTAFLDQVVRPSLIADALGDAGPRRTNAAADVMDGESRALTDIAYEILLGDKKLFAMLETSAAWHARMHGMNAGIAVFRRSWKTPFDRVDLPDGSALVALKDTGDLIAEGLAMSHCVGGYSSRCEDGRSVVASLRRTDRDGVEASSSTVEFHGPMLRNGAVRIVQHHAAGNGPPSADDRKAIEAFAKLERGRHPFRSRLGPFAGLAAALREFAERFAGMDREIVETLKHVDGRRCTAHGDGESELPPDDVARNAEYDWRRPGAIANAVSSWVPLMRRDRRPRDASGMIEIIDAIGHREFRERLMVRMREAAAAVDEWPSRMERIKVAADVFARRFGQQDAKSAFLGAMIFLQLATFVLGWVLPFTSSPADWSRGEESRWILAAIGAVMIAYGTGRGIVGSVRKIRRAMACRNERRTYVTLVRLEEGGC
jgi:hypothetical protein